MLWMNKKKKKVMQRALSIVVHKNNEITQIL